MANAEVKRRPLPEDGIRLLLGLKHDDITLDFLKDNFAALDKKPPKYNFSDEFVLTAEDADKLPIPKVKSDITTTAGRFICNYFLFGNSEITKFIEFLNAPFTKKSFGKIESKLCALLLEKKVSGQAFEDFIDREQWMGYSMLSWLTPSLTTKMYNTNPEVTRMLHNDIAANREKVEAADVNTCTDITNKAYNAFKESIKDDPTYDWLASGTAKDSIGPMTVARGLIAESKDATKLKFIESNLQDGIPKDEIPDYADIGIAGACSRGIETQQGGYVRKKMNSAFAHCKLGEPGTDCGTKYGIDIVINEKTQELYHLRYCIYEGKEYLLDMDTIKLLMGKRVRLRSPLFCTSDEICNKCAGEFYYRMGSRNVGLLSSSFAGGLLNLSLKGFHEVKITASTIDIDKYTTRLK